jgi:hypothetical protein
MPRKTAVHQQGGFITIMVIFGVGLFALASALILAVTVATELAKNKNTVLGDQAAYRAEAAANEGVKQCLDSFTGPPAGPTTIPCTVNSTSALVDFNGNPAATIAVTRDLSGLPFLYVTGAATNGQLERHVVKTISWFPAGSAFTHAMVTQGDIEFGGTSQINATTGRGSIYSNGNVTLSGTSTVDGNVYHYGTCVAGQAHQTCEDHVVDGFVKKANNTLPILNLDFTAYQSIATQAFADVNAAKGYLNNNTHSDLVYVSDVNQLQLTGNNTEFTGSLVTRGSLKLSGGTFTNSDNTHATIMVNGDLEISGGVDITGIVYVTGTTSFSGNNTIRGTVISLGGINAPNGGSIITFDPSLVSNWQNFVGLNINGAGATPAVVGWKEE